MGQHVSGGILGALKILKDHWGPVGRDLANAHYRWDDVGDGLPFAQFVQLIVYAPPGTAVFHVINDGWTADTHKIADLLDAAFLLLWSKTEDGQNNRNRPDPSPRPGQQTAEPYMTIGDYIELAGLEGYD